MIKLFILSILFAIGINHAICQPANDKQFEKAVKEVVLKLTNADSAGLAKYLDKNTGVYLIYRMGISNTFKNFSTISFNDSSYPNLLFFHEKIKISKLKYASLPRYNCDDNTWSKKGTFVNPKKIDHLLSNTARANKKDNPGNISQKTIVNFNNLEIKSRRIVMTSDDGNDLIFYLSYINKKWFLTIIDTVTTDCSA